MSAGKDALLDPGLQQRRTIASDRVNEAAAPATEAAFHHAAERHVVLDADVLEHADGHEGIVLPADVAVIVLNILDLAGESLALGALASPGDLLVRDVEGAHAHAVAARHVHRQHPPAAPGLDHA